MIISRKTKQWFYLVVSTIALLNTAGCLFEEEGEGHRHHEEEHEERREMHEGHEYR